ncbi:hypothetical protein GCM10027578_18100 [Spirosoma luteolum]
MLVFYRFRFDSRMFCVLLAGFLLAFAAGAQPRKPARSQPTTFSLKAVDSQTAALLTAQFSVTALQAHKTFSGRSQGNTGFTFVLTRTDTLNVVAASPGYQEAEELMVVSCDTCPDYEYIIRLDRATAVVTSKASPPPARPDSVFRNLRVNAAVRLDNVYFDQSSYVLRPESYPQLDKLVKTLRSQPTLVIMVAGHTDNVGDRRLNQALSENRAKVIQSYLIRAGIAEKRLEARGLGDTQPVAPNDTEENKRMNRRVEFVVLAM